MELKHCELPQGMRLVHVDESISGIGLYIPRNSLNASATVQLSILAGNNYLDRREAWNPDADRQERGYEIWFTDKGRRFMDDYRRFADLLHYIGMDRIGETKEELPELDRTDLLCLDYYNALEYSVVGSNSYKLIYATIRDGKVDLQSYPALARLQALGLVAVSLLDDANDPQPEKLFRISVTDRGREVLRRAMEKNR